MTRERRRGLSALLKYLLLILVGFVMLYPLLWMVGASFKSNAEIFSGIGLLPKQPSLRGYRDAMGGYGGDINIWQAMLNTYKIVIPKVVFTLLSCTVTAYGFARFHFKGRNFLFLLLMSTLFCQTSS